MMSHGRADSRSFVRRAGLSLVCAAVCLLAFAGGAGGQDEGKTVTGDPRQQWNRLFSQKGYIFGTEPIPLLRENLGLLRPGKALVLAMGEGRNAVFLARNGFEVTGIDISEVAAEKCRKLAAAHGVEVEIVVADLRDYEFPEAAYDLITNLYFPQPSLLPKIKKALKPGGIFVYEQWLPYQPGGPRTHEPPRGTSGADVYQYSELSRGELLSYFEDYRVMLYREAILNHAATSGQPGSVLLSDTVSLIARKPFD
jgi:SAM-dependent methyltransferase